MFAADNLSRQNFQMHFFLGALRVKNNPTDRPMRVKQGRVRGNKNKVGELMKKAS